MPYHVGMPLVYAIDDWHQLGNARSNTDPSLRIMITDFVNSDILEGIRISVIHPQYGVLYAVMPESTGRISAYKTETGLTKEQILKGLLQFGFDIIFKPDFTITFETRQALEAAQTVGNTHVRPVSLIYFDKRPGWAGHYKHTKNCVIAFNATRHPEFTIQYIPPLPANTPEILIMPTGEGINYLWLDRPMEIESVLTHS